MSQTLLPMPPVGATSISETISVVREDKKWTYFCGVDPIFDHREDDRRTFRMFTAQLCCQGACTQAQIMRTFGVSKMSVLRSVKMYREKGVDGFYRPRKGRGPAVMTGEVCAQAEKLLELGHTRRQVADELGISYDTLGKALGQGRVRKPAPPPADEAPGKPAASDPPIVPSDKSTRSDADAAAGQEMGVACTRPCERVLAALGHLPGGAPTRFQPCRDVTNGGVLCALPALAANGLFESLKSGSSAESVGRSAGGRPTSGRHPAGRAGPRPPGVDRIVARLGPARPSGTRPPSAGLAGPLPAPHPAEEHQRCPHKSLRRHLVAAGLSSDDGWMPRCGRPR